MDFVKFMLVKLYEDKKSAIVEKIIKETLLALYKIYKEKIESQVSILNVSSILE